MTGTVGTVDYGLLRRHSALLVCVRCLARGLRRSIPQVISPRHRLRTLCPDCEAERYRPSGARNN